MNKYILVFLLFMTGCGNEVVVIAGSDGWACMRKIDGKYKTVPCNSLTSKEKKEARWIDAMGVKVNE